MILFYSTEVTEDQLILRDDEFRHAAKSLRKKKGQNLQVIDGKGHLYQVVVEEIKRNELVADIVDKKTNPRRLPALHIAIAPTKNMNRFEWFVEKVVEMGIHKITPIVTEHSERKSLNLDRVNRIAVSAMKQSLHFYLPEIQPLISWMEFISGLEADEAIMAHFDPKNKHLFDIIEEEKNYTILIGPEGDFSDKEMDDWNERQYIQANISAARLRTETAGIAASNIFHTKNRTQTQ